MILFNSIITLILSVHLSSAIPRSKNELALELKIPKFVNSLLGIDDSVQTFRATVGSLKPKSNSNDLTFSFSTSNNSNIGTGIHKRAKGKDSKVMKINVKGVNEAAAVFRSILKPLSPSGSTQDLFTSIMEFMRRSTLEVKPRVEAGPGVYKTEILKYPDHYFEKRLKHLVKLKQKQEQDEKQLN